MSEISPHVLIGIDTGGTFTDFVALEGSKISVHKVLSDKQYPERAILTGIREMGLEARVSAGDATIIHGTTVATNATLEGKGARTAYITNQGFRDVLTIGRQTRWDLYSLSATRKEPPVPRELLVETNCRMDSNGIELEALEKSELARISARIDAISPDAVAINLLFSFLDSAQEVAIETALGQERYVSRSSFVLPEYREYERGIATWLNAFLGPVINRYMQSLDLSIEPSRLSVMQSSGVTMAADKAGMRAVNLLLSGPVGGLVAAAHVGALRGKKRLMTFDMGGTSTDVSLYDGRLRLTTEAMINNLPIAIPMVDIHTIGAGGGSIASIDVGGLLQVGPASAGAEPGPACYAQGGDMATVTDANLVLGRLLPDRFLGGRMILDLKSARSSLENISTSPGESVEQTALGIIKLANIHMSQALREISIQRGFDPRQFILTCFGGAGGLHVCELAESLDMSEAMLPSNAGTFSALGMLASPPGREYSRTHRMLLQESSSGAINTLYAAMEKEAVSELQTERLEVEHLRFLRSMDLRYVGQTFTLNIEWHDQSDAIQSFHQSHEARYGHLMDKPVELLNLRLRAEGEPTILTLPEHHNRIDAIPWTDTWLTTAMGQKKVPVYERGELALEQKINGPGLITESHATTLISEGWRGQLDLYGNLILDRLP